MNINSSSKLVISGNGKMQPLYLKQDGAVLVVSLFILLIMTLVGVTSMSTTSLEEKMAGNMRDKNISLQASESSLEDGEAWLISQATKPAETTTCGAPPCSVWAFGILPNPAAQLQTWWQSNALEYGTAGVKDIGDVNTDPYYVIEAQTFVKDSLGIGTDPPTGRYFYRITARGTGGSDDAQSMLQSTYAVRFN